MEVGKVVTRACGKIRWHCVDAALDTVVGNVRRRSFSVLKSGGTLVCDTQTPSQEEAARHQVSANLLETQTSPGSLQTLTRLIDADEINRCVVRSSSKSPNRTRLEVGAGIRTALEKETPIRRAISGVCYKASAPKTHHEIGGLCRTTILVGGELHSGVSWFRPDSPTVCCYLR